MKAFEVGDFERKQHRHFEQAFLNRQIDLENERLQRVHQQIHLLEAKNMLTLRQTDQLKNLRQEEKHILDRLDSLKLDSVTTDEVEPSHLESSINMEEAKFDVRPEEEHFKEDKNEQVEELFSEEGESKEPESDESEKFNIGSTAYEDDNLDNVYTERLKSFLPTTMTPDFFLQPIRDQLHLEARLPCVQIAPNFFALSFLWDQMFPYQREGILWFYRLYLQHSGGILGDEMGLGKCVQTIGFISSLLMSGYLDRPALIVAPTTLLRQWLMEFHLWSPILRVLILHHQLSSVVSYATVLKTACTLGHVVVTSYGWLRRHPTLLLKIKWKVVVLDEGHGIRNPSTTVSQLCRQFRTDRRFILSGTPIQNNLMELWTLMDFCHPGLLGSVFAFRQAFAEPIRSGGFVNATHLQVQQAQKCAYLLRHRLQPYLLRRLKATVAKQLPAKTEKIILCPLTEYQRQLYEEYLQSDDIQLIYSKRKNALAGIDVLRKICNHPMLLRLKDDDIDKDFESDEENYESIWGSALCNENKLSNSLETSGKMVVLKNILEEWHSECSSKCLLFCQTRQMLDLVQKFVQEQRYTWLRMDGTTPVNQRAFLVDQFNSRDDIFLFLLTTRVGGLGVNLTGANRVIIVDPDWNPSTDLQARERAWRLGQRRSVLIYRLLSGDGSIEEKIFQRQIFKQYLTKKILQDASYASKLFSRLDLYDLFAPLEPKPNEQIINHSADEESVNNKYEIDQDIMQVCNVPESSKGTSGTKGRLLDAESSKYADDSLKLIESSIQELKTQLNHLLKNHPQGVTSKAILATFHESNDSLDAILLKRTLKNVARFDKSSKLWHSK